MVQQKTDNYIYNPNPPIPKKIPVDDSGIPIFYVHNDRAVKVVEKKNDKGETVWVAKTRFGDTTFSLAEVMQTGHPITEKKYLTMVDSTETILRKRKII